MIDFKFLPCRIPQSTVGVWEEYFSSPKKWLFPTDCDKWIQSKNPRKPIGINPFHVAGGFLIVAAFILALVFFGRGWDWLRAHSSIPSIVSTALNLSDFLRTLALIGIAIGGSVSAIVAFVRKRRKR
jgi:hypothetical protein